MEMAKPVVFTASSDPDIVYLHEPMKAPDQNHFS